MTPVARQNSFPDPGVWVALSYQGLPENVIGLGLAKERAPTTYIAHTLRATNLNEGGISTAMTRRTIPGRSSVPAMVGGLYDDDADRSGITRGSPAHAWAAPKPREISLIPSPSLCPFSSANLCCAHCALDAWASLLLLLFPDARALAQRESSHVACGASAVGVSDS